MPGAEDERRAVRVLNRPLAGVADLRALPGYGSGRTSATPAAGRFPGGRHRRLRRRPPASRWQRRQPDGRPRRRRPGHDRRRRPFRGQGPLQSDGQVLRARRRGELGRGDAGDATRLAGQPEGRRHRLHQRRLRRPQGVLVRVDGDPAARLGSGRRRPGRQGSVRRRRRGAGDVRRGRRADPSQARGEHRQEGPQGPRPAEPAEAEARARCRSRASTSAASTTCRAASPRSAASRAG